MARHGLWRISWMTVLIGAGVCSLGESITQAAEKETRTFSIRIDNRPAGMYQMTISRPDDRTFIVDSRADVSVSKLFIKYKYNYQGTELWKDGRLVRLNSKTNDDGKQFEVLAQAEGERLRVQVNGKEYTTPRPDVWTTTYWTLPDPKLRNQAVALLDCDTGKVLGGTMQPIGTQQLTLAGQTQNCPHYRITGDVQVDVWYDAQQRLVREVSLDDGHRIVLELARID